MLLSLKTGPLKRQLSDMWSHQGGSKFHWPGLHKRKLGVICKETGLRLTQRNGLWDPVEGANLQATDSGLWRDWARVLWSWTCSLRNCENKLATEAFGLRHFVMAALTDSCWVQKFTGYLSSFEADIKGICKNGKQYPPFPLIVRDLCFLYNTLLFS